MFFFGLRGAILLGIAAILVLRIAFRFVGTRSNTISGPRWNGGPARNAFCTHCGAPLQGAGSFCGNCGARRE